MSDRCELRKETYRYIQERLRRLQNWSGEADGDLTVSLNELSILKEGIADPSPALVAALKRLIGGAVTEAEIDAHLVAPFTKQIDISETNSQSRRPY